MGAKLRVVSFKSTGNLKTELELASQQSGRPLMTQAQYDLQMVLRVAQHRRSLDFVDYRAEANDHSSQLESYKVNLTEEEFDYLKELANEYGMSVSKLIRILLWTARGLHKRVSPKRHLLGKEELVALILLELQASSRRIQ